METRRNSKGQELGPREFDPRSYDERQMPDLFPRQSIADHSDLNGPDLSDAPADPVEVVGDEFDVWAQQHVNRWTFLKHQRPAALKELRELIEAVRGKS